MPSAVAKGLGFPLGATQLCAAILALARASCKTNNGRETDPRDAGDRKRPEGEMCAAPAKAEGQ